MNVPEKLELPLVIKDTDGNEHEVERLVYRLERGGKSRWFELFGTPERATRTLFRFTPTCRDCALRDECEGMDDCLLSDYDALLEWLRDEDGVIDEPDTIRNELADGGLIADVLAPVCVDEKERRAFERGRVHERFAQQIFKEAWMRGDAE